MMLDLLPNTESDDVDGKLKADKMRKTKRRSAKS